MSIDKHDICGVILAAGAGIRLGYPNERGGKPMVPVLGKPLMAYALERMREVGILDVVLVVNPVNRSVIEDFVGDGSNFGLHVDYAVQETPLGIAHALSLCKDFSGDRHLMLLLVDNLFSADIRSAVADYAANPDGAEVFLIPVPNPQDYGVAVVENGHVQKLVEKPQQPISDLAVIGLYFYPPEVYDLIPQLSPSARGELEITDVNILFLEQGRLNAHELSGWWIDVGTTERLAEAERLLSAE
jgi:glucose-1-phosphate thymidylyltransferase